MSATGPVEPAPHRPPWRTLLGLGHRPGRPELLIALLLAVLGFGAVLSVQTQQRSGPLATAREDDLVRILDDLSNRSDRLRGEVSSLQATRDRLTAGTGSAQAALVEARRRAQLLAVLAGTSPATGPGVVVRVDDPKAQVGADLLLDAVEELRDAGAEAVQLDGRDPASGEGRAVRVVASTSFADVKDGEADDIAADGTHLRAPYALTAIGDPATLAKALAIPGGVVDSVAQVGASAQVAERSQVVVSALKSLQPARYAQPDDQPSPSPTR